MEREMAELAVLVGACLDRSGCTPEELESDLDQVMEMLEAQGAIGPVAGCDLERSVIDMRFSVEAEDSAAVHRRIGDITETIDAALGGRVTTSMSPADQVELACA
jgi:hypothetical protein